MLKLKNQWSLILPNIFTALEGVLLYLIGHSFRDGIFGGVAFNLYFSYELSRCRPWQGMDEREKAIAKNFWLLNATLPESIMFTMLIHAIFFPFTLSIYVLIYLIAIATLITGSISWYLNSKGISEKYVAKVLETGGLFWRG